MNKKYFMGLIALGALTVTSCSNDEVMDAALQQEAKAIQFSTYLGRDVETKASALTSETLKNFGVFASYTGQEDFTSQTMNFMFNQKVVENVSAWEYTPLKYWPAKQGEKISFFAYAPFFAANGSTPAITCVSSNTDSGAPKVKFAINTTEAENMVDFVAGVVMDRLKTNNSEDDDANTVKFKLHHELARVNFAAKLDRNAFGDEAAHKTKINITDVQIDKNQKLYASANYQFATTNDTPEPTPTYTKGTWSNHQATTTDFNITSILNKNTDTELGSYTTPGVIVPTQEVVDLFLTDQYLFFIPSPTTVDESDVVNVTFKYDIITADAALNGGYVSSTATKTVSIKASNFTQGEAKKYVFTFGLHEIKVAAEVEAWPAENDGDSTNVDWTDTDSSITEP